MTGLGGKDMTIMMQRPSAFRTGTIAVACRRVRGLLRFVAAATVTIGLTAAQETAAAEQVQTGADVDVRPVIERSVPIIEREGAAWMAARACVSCHHTAFMVWSLRAAKRSGVSIDDDKLRDWTDWAGDYRHLMAPPTDGKEVDRAAAVGGQSDTLAQLVLSQSASLTSVQRPTWAAEYVADLVKLQQADGSWKSGGQLPSQKRSKRETQEVSTMWALLATAQTGEEKGAAADVAKAVQWLGEETAGKSTEWWAVRAVLERRLEHSQRAENYRGELLKRQHSDGGWGWLCDEQSDALATGMALFSLSGDETPDARKAIAEARMFLTRTQAVDGSWAVRGTKESAKDRVTPTATFWGTCWAVIGLSESK
jgi:squalene-hopene/tetraprenyl-beta-curcumene cyclase